MAKAVKRPFTRSQVSKLLLELPGDHVTQMIFDSLSTKDAAILSSVNPQLRHFALAYTPAFWKAISIELPNAKEIVSFLGFLARIGTKVQSLELRIRSDDIGQSGYNDLTSFPLLPNVTRLILSHNPWLLHYHIKEFVNRMPAVEELAIDDCANIRVGIWREKGGCLEVFDSHYGHQLKVFSCDNQYDAMGPMWGNAMTQLASKFSKIIKLNVENGHYACPSTVVASMLDRSPDIQDMRCGVRADAEASTFLSAVSSCRQLTHLCLDFGRPYNDEGYAYSTVTVTYIRAALANLTKLKYLAVHSVLDNLFVEPADGEGADEQLHDIYPFELDSLKVTTKPNLPPFLRRLILSQVQYLNKLGINSPGGVTELVNDLFTGRPKDPIT